MAKEHMVLSDGTFSFAESDVENQFYFYRNDGEVLGDVGRIPMDFYQHYIMHKMFSGEINGGFVSNLKMEVSDDDKCIRITVVSADEIADANLHLDVEVEPEAEPVKSQSTPATSKQPNFFKRMLKKLFG